MKKIVFLISFCFTLTIAQSQEVSDALRYAQNSLNGTARFQSMGGAFGALGGDLSSMNVNPAGYAVFSNNQVGATLSNSNTNNQSDYFGSKTSTNENSFDLPQAGGVFVFKNQRSDWNKVALGVNYEMISNFDNNTYSRGVNPTNSIDQYFLSYANGVPLEVLEKSNYEDLNNGGQQAFLGYQGYVINPVNNTDTNTLYNSNVRQGGNYFQENSVFTTGNNNKLSLNLSTSYKDRLYLGMNLNFMTTEFRQYSSFFEENNNVLDINDRVNRLTFNNDLYTYGTGFSFQLGAIAKVTDNIRFGLAYESASWYDLQDEFYQNLTVVSSNIIGELPADIVDPDVINVYAPYQLQTPSKFTGSFAYVFNKKGLISIDYSIKDYSNTKFKPENDAYFSDINQKMNNILTSAGELRIGGEYKINQWSLRGGYRMEQSPYKNASTIGDLTAYSGGLGYSFGATKLDLSYSSSQRDSNQGFFNQGFTDGANTNTKINTFTATLLFEL